MGIEDVLSQQSIRLDRTKWQTNCDMLAYEMRTILQSLKSETTGPISVNIGTNNPFQLPGIDTLTIPPIDFVWPELVNPTDTEITDDRVDPDTGLPPEDDPVREDTITKTETTYSWWRATAPGQVVGRSDTGTGFYQVEVYPNGFLESSADSPFSPNITLPGEEAVPDGPYHRVYEVQQLDGSGGIPANTWTLVFRIVELQIVTRTKIDRKTQKEVSRETEINIVKEQTLMAAVPPTGRIAKTTSEISGMSGTNLGSGTVTFYDVVNGTLQQSTDSNNQAATGTAYSMVKEPVKADKFVQIKYIGGLPFVDVEDCSDEEG